MPATKEVDIIQMGIDARNAARSIARSTTEQRDNALKGIAKGIIANTDNLIENNRQDLDAAAQNGIDPHVAERMTLNRSRIQDMADAANSISELQDPLGEVLEQHSADNGLNIQRIRTPLGVIGVIYESRPNVTIDIASLCIKAGNTVILRGGKEAIKTNSALAKIVRHAVKQAGLPTNAVQFVESTNRAIVTQMLAMDKYIDLLIPRGSAELVHMVAENAKMPAVTGGVGVCHAYVDSSADIHKAVEVVFNAKTQRHTVCNALDTLLIHESIANNVLQQLAPRLGDAGVEVRADNRTWTLLGPKRSELKVARASDDDFGTEFLAKIISIKVVDEIDDALAHIDQYGSGHSEAIIAEDKATIEHFLRDVDASAVFANASTRFNDGGEFGLGAEVAISTDKLHARGPMGMREIMSYKWVVRGNGHIRT